MRKQAFVLTLGVVLLAVVATGMLLSVHAKSKRIGGGAVHGGIDAGEYRLSGPYTHRNLTIFLVHGKNLIKSKSILTLQEALVQKKVVVYETKSVNELSIQNFSNSDVYVQAGDIVKGGAQDRMI